MWFKPKAVIAAGLAACLLFPGTGDTVRADDSVDLSTVSIISKVDEFIEKGGDEAVASLTGKIIEVAEEPVVPEEPEEPVIEEATETDAVKYAQFDGKAIAAVETELNIRTEQEQDAEIIGVLYRCGLCDVIEKGDEWTLVESGECKGYVRTKYLRFGDDAAAWSIENGYSEVATVDADGLNVREQPDEESESLKVAYNGEYFPILEKGDEWTKIKLSDSEEGYVSTEYVTVGFRTSAAVTMEEILAARKAEEEKKAAEEAEKAEQAKAEEKKEDAGDAEAKDAAPDVKEEKKSETVTEEATEAITEAATEAVTEEPQKTYAEPAGSAGQDIADYAVQFVGNPYVYGGTSLTNGADCSGFVMSVYAAFGYSLPRVACDQVNRGVEVDMSDLQPGDIIGYGGGYIGHVGIYIGGGQIVHAASSTQGIITQNYDYHTPTKAVRIVNN